MHRGTPSNSVRPPFLLRAVRGQPHLYSAICRARLLYSRRVAGADMRELYRANRPLFALNDFEKREVQHLQQDGFALMPGFFSADLIDRVFRKSDRLFRELQIDFSRAYSIQSKLRTSLAGLSYQELAASEKMIALRDPLINVPESVDIAFHPSILKMAAAFLGYIPPLYRVTIVRDFPHNRPLHSSNFHKDNDESDSLQIFIYLVDIDDRRGPLVYVPGSNHHDVRSCRPRLSRDLGVDANDGRFSDAEIERAYPRDSWAVLRTGRGSIAAIHGNGIHKGPAWARPGDPANQPRTAIKLDLHGYKAKFVRDMQENCILREDFGRLSDLQKLFAHATVVDNLALPALVH
jgi:Phytanoyl-CoA dioxygenase (PhyH)